MDLRITPDLLDLHALRDHRRYYDRTIASDVEYHARLHSVAFVDRHADLLGPRLDGAEVVDLGCGQAPYINRFPAGAVETYYGLDLSTASLEAARRGFRGGFRLVLIRHGVGGVPLADASADAVISSEVLEHLDDPHAYLCEAYRVCRPGGYLSLSMPCASMYLYPHALLSLAAGPGALRHLYNQMNPQRCWQEALRWHPGLRPAVLRRWVRRAGFSVLQHETRLWYYHTPLRPVWRLCAWLEARGVRAAGRWFRRYVTAMDRLLALRVPVLRWCGIRQFVLARKDPARSPAARPSQAAPSNAGTHKGI